MDTGMLKHEVGEMNRRVSGYEEGNPKFSRHSGGSQNWTTAAKLTELQRNTVPLDEFRQGTEYQPYNLQKLRLSVLHREGTEPSRNRLMSVNAGLLKENQNKMDSSEHKENHKAVPVESRRQGTEPSRRFLMDMDTGMLKQEVGEMNRRVSGFYNPPAYEMRKGTQNSHATLVDPRTGQLLPPLTELQRNTVPLDEFRHGTEYQLHTLQELRMHGIVRPQYSA
ncbi:uncharacterized protein LOC131544136 [Onychostoma macrolepis]|uniref:uncharacterized protein LOC131544136 n=1 Tax=Onychostoma macrolepis TaxID=369639 RepID=UPI00272C61DA|nr:uncharacterized protein LOC131544136 [Onychostoma macrolepis]